MHDVVGQLLLGERSITAEMWCVVRRTRSLVVLLLLVVAMSLSLLVRAAPVYDCAYDASRLPMCEWSTDQLHSKLLEALEQRRSRDFVSEKNVLDALYHTCYLYASKRCSSSSCLRFA